MVDIPQDPLSIPSPPDAPGDFSETQTNQVAAPPGKRPNPFTPLTPAQERDERARLNIQAASGQTMLGSALTAGVTREATGLNADEQAVYPQDVSTGQASSGSEIPTYDGSNPNFAAQQDDAKDRLVKMQSDQQAYENMPGYKGVVEGAYSLFGQAFGGAMSPENLIFPEVKFASTAWRVAHPFMSDIIGWGLGQAAISGFSNPVVQANEVEAGLRKEFDPVEMSLAIPEGFVFGAGLAGAGKGAGYLYRYTRDAMDKWALAGIMKPPTLTPEVKPPVEPEPPRAPADTFDVGGTQTVPGASPVAPAAAGMPGVAEGSVRLYREAAAGDEGAKRVTFSTTQFPGSNEYLDVPVSVAAQMVEREGDRVTLPADVAAARRPVPEGAPGSAPSVPEAKARSLQIADEMDAMGGDAAGYAKGIRTAVNSEMFKPESVDFYERRLASMRAQAGSVADRPNQAIPLEDFIDRKHRNTLDRSLSSYPAEIQSVVADAKDAFTGAIRDLNAEGFKFTEVNTHTGKDNPAARAAQKQAMEIGGSLSRLLNGIKHTKSDFNSPRVQGDIRALRQTIESRSPLTTEAPAATGTAAPAAKPTPKDQGPSVFDNLTDYSKLTQGKSKQPQTFTQWVRANGGLKPTAELKTIYGRTKADLVRKNGMSMDQVLEKAAQDKWLFDKGEETGGVTTLSHEDILKMLDDEARGKPRYHPGEAGQAEAAAAKVKTDPKLTQTMEDIDAAMHEIGVHPDQTEGRAAKGEAKDIRNRAIEIAYTEEGVHPEIAVDRAMQEYGEHERAAAGDTGHPLVEGHPDIPFDTEAASGEGGRGGEAEPGLGAPGNAPEGSGVSPPSAAESRIAKRLKGMAEQGVGVAPGKTRPTEGVAAAVAGAHESGLTPLENLQDMMRRISAKLDLTVRKGVHERGALGQYDFETHIVRIKDMGPDGVTTWAHELAHDIENRMGRPVTDLIAANPNSMRAFAGVMGEGLGPKELGSEGFAEFMAGYITNRGILERKDPGFVKTFREMMAKENPELLATLDDAHRSFEAYNSAPSGQAVDSMVVTHGEIPKPDPNDPLKRSPLMRWLGDFYMEYVNKQHPMTVAVRYLAREYQKKYGKLLDLRPDQDPRLLAQVLGDAGFSKTVMDLTYGIQSLRDLTPEGPSPWSILRRVTADPVTGHEASTAAQVLARRKSFDMYLIAKWHLELRRQMTNGEIELTRMPTGMTDGDALKKIAETDQLHPDWAGLAEEQYAVIKLKGKLEQESGLRSAESYADIMNPRNHQYVPLQRDMRGITETLGVGATFRGDKPLEDLGHFRREGSGRNILSPTETFMSQLAEVNDAANQNMIVTALRDLVLKVGGKEGAAIAEMVPNAELRALDINVNNAVYKAAIDNGWMKEDAESLVRNLQHELGADIRTKLYQKEAIKPGSRPIVFGWANGERFAMRLSDGLFGRQLVEVMDSIGPRGIAQWAQAGGLVVDALTFSSSTLRAGATGTPTFMAKNLLRDAFMQFLLVPEAGADTLAMANAIRGGKSYLLGDDFYRMNTSLGGIRGGVGAATFSRSSQQIEFERGLKRYKNQALNIQPSAFGPAKLQAARIEMADALGKAGLEPHKQIWFGNIKEAVARMEISESAGRVGLFRAVYEANLAMGRDKRYAMFDAAQKARDFIDYGRRGSKMEMISRMVPFLNANVQGVDKFIRTYAGTPSSPGMFFKPFTQQQADYQRLLRTSLGPRVAAMAAISAAITYIYEDDPVYQRIPVQQRASNWIFRLPFIKSGKYDLLNGDIADLPEGMQGAWIFIPKPWEPGSIFNLAERAVQFINTGDPDHIDKALKSMSYSFSLPNPLSFPLVSTAQGLASNYDQYFERPIVSQSKQGLAPHLQANEYTNKFYVALAQGLNMAWNSQDAHTWFRQNIPVVGAMLAAPWSPMEAQFMMQGLFGDWPRELGGIGGIGRSLINAQTPNISDVPALRAFVKDRLAMGEPMNEMYNQIGQNGGRLTVANKTFTNLVKGGDVASATQYFNTLDQSQQDYIRAHQAQGGPLMNVLHPLDRTSALASVVRTMKDGMLSDNGLASLRDPNVRFPIEQGKRDIIIQAMNELTAGEARNALIIQGASGFKYLAQSNTQPYLDIINKISPEIGKELSARLAQAKVMPLETIQEYWPQAQRLLRAGETVRPNQLQNELKSLSAQAASHGYEGGGRRVGRGAVDAGGVTVKRGKSGPVSLPADLPAAIPAEQ